MQPTDDIVRSVFVLLHEGRRRNERGSRHGLQGLVKDRWLPRLMTSCG